MSRAECQRLAQEITWALEGVLKATSTATPGHMTQRVTIEVHPQIFHALSYGFEPSYDSAVPLPSVTRYVDENHIDEKGRRNPRPCLDLHNMNATIARGCDR